MPGGVTTEGSDWSLLFSYRVGVRHGVSDAVLTVSADLSGENQIAIAAVPGALQALLDLVASKSPGAQEQAAWALWSLAANGT